MCWLLLPLTSETTQPNSPRRQMMKLMRTLHLTSWRRHGQYLLGSDAASPQLHHDRIDLQVLLGCTRSSKAGPSRGQKPPDSSALSLSRSALLRVGRQRCVLMSSGHCSRHVSKVQVNDEAGKKIGLQCMQDAKSLEARHLERSKLESPAHDLHCIPECPVCSIDNRPEAPRHHPRCSWSQYARPYPETRLRFRSVWATDLPMEYVFFVVQLQLAWIVFLPLVPRQSLQSILGLLPCGRINCRVFRSRDPNHRTFGRIERSKDNYLDIMRFFFFIAIID